MIGEGAWARLLSPEEEAALIARLAAGRAINALRHEIDCSCEACRIHQIAARRRFRQLKASALARRTA